MLSHKWCYPYKILQYLQLSYKHRNQYHSKSTKENIIRYCTPDFKSINFYNGFTSLTCEEILYQENPLRCCNVGIAEFPPYLNIILYPIKLPIKAIAPYTNANIGAVNSFFTSSTVMSTISSDNLSTLPSCAASVISENDDNSEGKAITNRIADMGIIITFFPISSLANIFVSSIINNFLRIYLQWGQPIKEIRHRLTNGFLLEAPSFLLVTLVFTNYFKSSNVSPIAALNDLSFCVSPNAIGFFVGGGN